MRTRRAAKMMLWLLIGVVVVWAGFRLYLAYRLRTEIAAIRSAGLPTTYPELNAYYPEPPEGQNAAPRLLALMEGLYVVPERFKHLAPEQLQELRRSEREVSAALERSILREEGLQSDEYEKASAARQTALNRLLGPPPEPSPSFDFAAMERELSAQAEDLSTLADDSLPEVFTEDPPPAGQPFPPERRDAIGAFLLEHADRIAEIHRVAHEKHWRFPVDYTGYPDDTEWMGHLTPVKRAADLLKVEAIYRAEIGDAAGAVEALDAALALPHALAAEPMMISQLVRIACLGTALTAAAQVPSRVPLDSDQLRRLASAVDATDEPDAMFRAIVGERCLTEACSPKPRHIEDTSNRDLIPAEGWQRFWGANALTGTLYRLTGVANCDRLYALNILAECIEVLKSPLGERAARARAYEKRCESVPSVLCFSYDLSGVSSTFPRTGLFPRVHSGVTRVGLAVERYRGDRGRLPQALGDLVPEYLEAAPVDVYDGKPLRYKPAADSFQVYSVGHDGTDDGGWDSKAEEMGRRQKDAVFRVVFPRHGGTR